MRTPARLDRVRRSAPRRDVPGSVHAGMTPAQSGPGDRDDAADSACPRLHTILMLGVISASAVPPLPTASLAVRQWDAAPGKSAPVKICGHFTIW